MESQRGVWPLLHASPQSDSPIQITLHKTANGDLSISCRDRHCPKCRNGARDKWIMARQSELLPVAYVHVVFTLPHQLSPLALQNKKVLYDLLFRASAG